MKYKLYNDDLSYIDKTSIEQILLNRGISEDKMQFWLNPKMDYITSPWWFGAYKVKRAIKLMNDALMNRREIYVLVDCDADG